MGDSAQASAGASTTTTATTTPNYAGAGLTAAGGLTQAYASYQAGRQNKKIAQFNAKQAKVQEAQAIEAGQFAANRVAMRENQVEGADVAAAASSGVVARSGSNANAIASNRAMSHADELMIELNARRQAYGYAARAAAATSEGQMAERVGNQQAIATLLNTGGKEWQMYNRDHSDLVFAGGSP